MTLRKPRAVARGGFTLMEVLVVAAILVVLAGAGAVIYMRYLDDSREKTAVLGVQNIDKAVQAHRIAYGDYPLTLAELTLPIEGKPAALEEIALIDPWNHPYQYEPANLHPLTQKPRIYSLGPNQSNPIANW